MNPPRSMTAADRGATARSKKRQTHEPRLAQVESPVIPLDLVRDRDSSAPLRCNGNGHSVALPQAGLVGHRFYRMYLKRAIDVVLGSLLLVVFAPVLGVAWLAVRLTSRGPAVFPQKRVGLNGKLITMYKFRSMYIDHENRIDMSEIKQGEAQGLVYKSDKDPRVTPVGRFIRKTSIDELPQLWNVVRGDMSLVGPRPLVPHMLEPYPVIMAERSRVRPGITGLWQVSAREDNKSVVGMVKYDFQYVQDHSLWMDLWILLKTPAAVLHMRGAQ